MKKGGKVLTLVCGLLAIGLTVLLFALLVDDLFVATIKWMSVCFVVLAEVAFLTKTLKGGNDFIMNAQHIIGVVYILATFVFAIIYVNISDPNIKHFIAWESIALVITAVLDLTIWNFSKRAAKSDAALAGAQNVLNSCATLADEISVSYRGTEFSKDLAEIKEMLRFSDNSQLSGGEDQIMARLMELQDLLNAEEPKKEKVSEKINDIKASIKIRSSYIKNAQRGKF